MRELQVLGNGHLRLDFADWKEFFETEMAEQLRSQLKSMIEQALEAERDYYLQLNYYEHAPRCRLDYRNGYYFRAAALPAPPSRGEPTDPRSLSARHFYPAG